MLHRDFGWKQQSRKLWPRSQWASILLFCRIVGLWSVTWGHLEVDLSTVQKVYQDSIFICWLIKGTKNPCFIASLSKLCLSILSPEIQAILESKRECQYMNIGLVVAFWPFWKWTSLNHNYHLQQQQKCLSNPQWLFFQHGPHWATLRSETTYPNRRQSKGLLWWNLGWTIQIGGVKPSSPFSRKAGLEPLGTCSCRILWCPKIQYCIYSIYIIYLSNMNKSQLFVCFCLFVFFFFRAIIGYDPRGFPCQIIKPLVGWIGGNPPTPSAAPGWDTGWKTVSRTSSSRHLEKKSRQHGRQPLSVTMKFELYKLRKCHCWRKIIAGTIYFAWF